MQARQPKPNECGGKQRFTSKKKAEIAAARIAKREREAMHVYGCAQCHGLHVGSGSA